MKSWFAVLISVALLVCIAPSARASSSIDPTRISIPKGPGSIHGLGRSFSPSLASGTASYGVDIDVPPGAGGFGPVASLDYDSAGGISDLGMGWRIAGVPSLRRRTEDGLPRFDNTDTYEIQGFGVPSRLVEVSSNTFRPEYESGSFVRVRRGPDGGTWEARDKAGVTYKFGGAVEAEGRRVATYLLQEAVDLHGHRVAYTWDTSSGHGVLQSIVWNDYGDDVRNVVLFRYEARPDPHTLFSSGIKQTFGTRLTTIEVTHGGALVRRYAVAYGPGVHSRIASVTVIGSDGTSHRPVLSFGYTAPSFAAADQIVAMATPPGRSPGDGNVELADLDGDTLPDLLTTKAGAYRAYQNHDGRSWRPAVDWEASKSPSVELGTTGVQLADLDGDGAIDLVVKSGASDFRYFPGQSTTSFRQPVRIATVPNFSFEDPDVRLADIDADRRIDAIITTASGLAVSYNRGGVDWTVPQMVGTVDPRQPLRFSDGGHTQLCDVNGDRIEDFCYLRPQSLLYWLGRGRGVFESAQTASGVPNFDPSSPWELRDMDGDGWVDLVHVGVLQVDIALAVGAGRFDAPKTLTNTPRRGPNTTIRYADMNGSGSLDIVWIDVSGSPAQSWRYLELFPAGRAGLLNQIDNGLGLVTTISYGTAAEDAAAARAAGAPWTSRMNAGMAIVRRMQTDDGLGDPSIVIEYRYRNGTWSPVERTFAGFAGGISREDGDSYAPTLLTDSTFEVGISDRTMRGLVLAAETRDEAGYRFARTTTSYTSRAIATGMDGSAIHRTFRAAEEHTKIEGRDESRARRTLTEWEEDDFGNVVAERHWGEIRGDDKLAGHDESIVRRTFATNESAWIHGRIATEEMQDGRGARVRMSRQYYDGADFLGLPLGQIERGDMRRREVWIGPGDAFELDDSFRHDGDGHVLETRDARGGGHLFDWDNHDHTTLLRESVRTDTGLLTAHVDTDRAFGVVNNVTEFGGQITRELHDAFGRTIAIIRPGDTEDRPTLRYTYRESAPLSRVLVEARVWSGKDDVEHSETLVDGAGRTRGTLVHDEGDRWTLGGVGLLNARGRTRRNVQPRFITGTEHDAPPLLAEGAGTSIWQDALGRTLRTRSQFGIESRSAFEPFVEHIWDGAQSNPSSPYEHTPVTLERDGLGRLVRSRRTLDGATYAAEFAYDAAGALTSKTDPEGNVSRYTYDGRGQRLLVDDPDTGRHVFGYDPTGNLTTHRSPDGVVARFAFDVAGRAVSDDWDDDGKPEVTRSYDQSFRQPGSTNYLGKLVAVAGPSGATETEYDERGRTIAVHRVIDGHVYDTRSVYDARDREIVHVYPDESSIRLRYNARGLLTGYGRAVTIHYDADDLETRREFNTGVVQVEGYDADRRHRESRATAPSGTVLQHLAWTYDEASNIVAIQDKRPGVDATRDRSETYRYDNFYRLQGAQGPWGAATWRYSPSGNLLERTSSVPGLGAGTYAYEAARPHAPKDAMGRNIAYDVRGRMLDDGVREYTWNAGDQLVRVTQKDGASAESTFDGDGLRRIRVERNASGTVNTTYLLDPWSEVRDGKLVRFLVHSGRRFAQLSETNGVPSGAAAMALGAPNDGSIRARVAEVGRLPSILASTCIALAVLAALLARYRRRLRWFVPAVVAVVALGCSGEAEDAPEPDGTIQLLTDADELLFDDAIGSVTEQVTGTGTPKTSFAAFPYGVTRLDSSKQTRKYANSPRDGAVGLDQMGARSYAPDLSIWVSADPLAIEEPENSVGHSFAHANAYAYADLTPVVATDPSGRAAAVAIAVGAGIVFTAALMTVSPGYGAAVKRTLSGMVDGIRESLRPTPTPATPPVVTPTPAPAPQVTPRPASPPLLPAAPPPAKPVPHVAAAPQTVPADPKVKVEDLPRIGVYGGPRGGMPITRGGRREVIRQNKERNGGQTRCELCGIPTVPGSPARPGVPQARNETTVDHVHPEDDNGAGEPVNGQVTCRTCNGKKGNKVTNPSVPSSPVANDNGNGGPIKGYTGVPNL